MAKDVFDVFGATSEAFLRLIDLRRTMDPDEWSELAKRVTERAEALTEEMQKPAPRRRAKVKR